MSTSFKLGAESPHEGFVQIAIEQYFFDLGYVRDRVEYADFVCSHPETGERWWVEAKGVTSQVGLDLGPDLAELLQGMTDSSVKYACAVPDVDQFVKQCLRVSPWVRRSLGLYWLFVDPSGRVRVVSPAQITS